MTMVYGAVAHGYRGQGWLGVLPLPSRKKWPPPEGYTGYDGPDPTDDDIATWVSVNGAGNVGIRVPPGVIGYDSDLYKPEGRKTHDALVDKCGDLPATWVSTSRTDGSGIRFYRIPEGVKLRGAFGGVEIVQHHHRYAVVGPSIHPEGRTYRIISPDGETVAMLPDPAELPELPPSWLAELREADPVTGERRPRIHATGDWSTHVKAALGDALAGLVEGSRHDTALAAALHLARYDDLGYPGAADALDTLGRTFRAAINDRATPVQADREWDDIAESARTTVATTPSTAARWDDTREARQRIERQLLSGASGGMSTPALSDADAPPAEGSGQDGGKAKASQATLLVDLAEAAVFFHTPDLDPYADVVVGTHRETWPLRTKGFRRWLAESYFNMYGRAAGSQAVQDALGVLEGRALFAGSERDVHVRIAALGDAIYLDLGDPAWRAVEITAGGWHVVVSPPVRFRRPKGALALPEPLPGGTLTALRPFVNITADDWPLLVAFIVAAFRPTGPFPVLNLLGEHGTAKSTTARAVRALVDPNRSPARAEPREGRDLAIAAANSWMVSFDNISRLPVWLSDALCRLSTGGGFSTRELYSDSEEIIFDAQRPVIMNGIAELATRPDLLDRSLLLYLPRFTATGRKSEAALWAAFEQQRQRLLGAALDAVAGALRDLPSTTLAEAPRMADFALWAAAAEPSLGLEPGTILTAYRGNRYAANSLALEASPVAQPLLDLVPADTWKGTATQLLHALVLAADEDTQRQPGWPRGASALSNELRRLAPVLRAAGLAVTFEREGRGGDRRRLIVLERRRKTPSPPSPPSPTSSDQHKRGDGGDAHPVQTSSPSPFPVPPSSPRNRRSEGIGDDADGGDGVLQPHSDSVPQSGGSASPRVSDLTRSDTRTDPLPAERSEDEPTPPEAEFCEDGWVDL